MTEEHENYDVHPDLAEVDAKLSQAFASAERLAERAINPTVPLPGSVRVQHSDEHGVEISVIDIVSFMDSRMDDDGRTKEQCLAAAGVIELLVFLPANLLREVLTAAEVIITEGGVTADAEILHETVGLIDELVEKIEEHEKEKHNDEA